MTTFPDPVYANGGELLSSAPVPYFTSTYFVNAGAATTGSLGYVDGNDTNTGLSWASPFLTMTKALTKVQTGGRIVFIGDVREECTGSNLVFDVTIQGAGSMHHPDLPATGYHPGSSMWRVPSTGTTGEPLMTVRGRGWKFHNIFFDCPAAAAGIRLARNSLSTTSEYDAGHSVIEGCDFRNGLYAIEDYDGCFNVRIENCVFETIFVTNAGCAIAQNTGAGPASPRRWQILNNFFQADSSTNGNWTHIDLDLQGSLIKGNYFGTVQDTGLYIDLTGGVGNIVTENILMGAYNTSDYVAGTGDTWAGNQSLSASFGGNDAQGRTLAAPASST